MADLTAEEQTLVDAFRNIRSLARQKELAERRRDLAILDCNEISDAFNAALVNLRKSSEPTSGEDQGLDPDPPLGNEELDPPGGG